MSNNSTIQFRLAGPGDAAAIRNIVRSAYAKWVPVIGREPLPMRADYEKAVAEHPFELAVEDGRILGMMETMLEADHLWIENVCVAPGAQGRGIGRRHDRLHEQKAGGLTRAAVCGPTRAGSITGALAQPIRGLRLTAPFAHRYL